jgi:hypothetical protein
MSTTTEDPYTTQPRPSPRSQISISVTSSDTLAGTVLRLSAHIERIERRMAAIELHIASRPKKRVQTKADSPFDLPQANAADGNGQALKRGRGRPPSSKNRPKSELPRVVAVRI